MKFRPDLTGQRFGFLEVLELKKIDDFGHAHWLCRCLRPGQDGTLCGKVLSVRANKLNSGRQVSCGCSRADPEVRRDAWLQVPKKRRIAIASKGSKAWSAQAEKARKG